MISVGIDAAKGKSTVCIMKSYGEVIVPPRDIAHTASELQSFVFLLKSFGENVKSVMESTGTSRTLYYFQTKYLSCHSHPLPPQ
ncbi:IS110 family transposase [Anaerotignum propionicum]|uniref:IS110 family transposase n=1 Tax=Anaerotignum propionicum TaxID=28446 RepID=UPI002108FDE1|nr:IS110 family transposase [Anaerotignum propionicum]MCQ4936335.1 IS110 family transposase [Anaerotignum propionicum]